MGDRIELRGLRVMGVHGVLPEEQVRAQPFEIDLDVTVDLRAAGSSDALDDTVDYASMTSAAVAVVERERFFLLERLAARIAEAVLDQDDRVTSVEVGLRKLRPPVAAALGTAGVRIVRP